MVVQGVINKKKKYTGRNKHTYRVFLNLNLKPPCLRCCQFHNSYFLLTEILNLSLKEKQVRNSDWLWYIFFDFIQEKSYFKFWRIVRLTNILSWSYNMKNTCKFSQFNKIYTDLILGYAIKEVLFATIYVSTSYEVDYGLVHYLLGLKRFLNNNDVLLWCFGQ